MVVCHISIKSTTKQKQRGNVVSEPILNPTLGTNYVFCTFSILTAVTKKLTALPAFILLKTLSRDIFLSFDIQSGYMTGELRNSQ